MLNSVISLLFESNLQSLLFSIMCVLFANDVYFQRFFVVSARNNGRKVKTPKIIQFGDGSVA